MTKERDLAAAGLHGLCPAALAGGGGEGEGEELLSGDG
jgi:hypothetical protein